MAKATRIHRRRVLQATGLVAVGAWVWAAPRLSALRELDLTFSPVPDFPPFRNLERRGEYSGSAGALVGIGATSSPKLQPEDICSALFGDDAGLAIALFSDFNCPNCPQMDANVQTAVQGGDMRVVRHELPLLGDSSVLASKAVLAADLQGGYAAMHARLLRTRSIVTPSLISRYAMDAGLDDQRLLADMESQRVKDRIAQSLALKRSLALIGTPASVIGRTVVLGTLSLRQIRQIINLERSLPPPCQNSTTE